MKKVVLFFLFTPFLTYGHPVIYKDGWVYDSFFMPSMNIQRVAYTVEPYFALEMNTSYIDHFDGYRDYTLGINYLFKRWFSKKSQANIYGMLHGGYFDSDTDQGAVGHAALMGDWETGSLEGCTRHLRPS